jgi:hypothetical protein
MGKKQPSSDFELPSRYVNKLGIREASCSKRKEQAISKAEKTPKRT